MQKRGLLAFGILAIMILGILFVPFATANLGLESKTYKDLEAGGAYTKEDLIAKLENGYFDAPFLRLGGCTHEPDTNCPDPESPYGERYTGESCSDRQKRILEYGLMECDYIKLKAVANAAYQESLNAGSTTPVQKKVTIDKQITTDTAVPISLDTKNSVTPELTSSNVGFAQGILYAFSQLLGIAKGLFGFP